MTTGTTWERVALKPMDRYSEIPGTRLSLRDPLAGTLATIVRFPGTLWRVYWNGGRISDYKTEAEAVEAVELHFELR